MPERLRFHGPAQAPVLLVGEAPGRRLVDREHLGLIRRDLAELAGVRYPTEFCRLFARANVFPSWPGRNPSGKGDRFPLKEAREFARVQQELFRWWSCAILLGRRVERAFRLKPLPLFTWRDEYPTTRLVVVPHPSKISRWWNDPANVTAARKFWAGIGRLAARALEDPQ